MFHNVLKEKLMAGRAALGTFMVCNAPDLVEVAALSGFDFVILDGEHGPMAQESMQGMIRAAEVRGITPIVRIPDHLESTVLHELDIGAHGLQIPQVNDAETARALVAHAKYRPQGHRGVAFPRASDYGIGDISGYFARANEETLLVMHCENERCLDELDAICQVPGTDVIFLGPYDMSQSLGITGQVGHPLIEEAAERVLEACRRHGKVPGIFCGDGASARRRAEQGFLYIPVGMDTTLFAAKCQEEIAKFRG
ncbi:MAG: 4-hydroxy-2-oxovalerate aldolase [Synergistaceae bacterium]|nr:4-hydroxy-2-oxovalerate aldolase [Synergistaceae bacterium]